MSIAPSLVSAPVIARVSARLVIGGAPESNEIEPPPKADTLRDGMWGRA
jgi:hypothetical protein